jgi:hypothetical protein
MDEVELNPLVHGWVMPAGVAHGGEVLEDAEYLDGFAPPRQDFSWYKQKL